jgi:hypothetical protein
MNLSPREAPKMNRHSVGHSALYCQVGEKPVDFPFTHLQRTPFVVIEDKMLGPVDVGLLGVDGVVNMPPWGHHQA